MAALDAWRQYGSDAQLTAQAVADRYALLGMFYKGTWAADPRIRGISNDVYRNARQVVKKTGAIVDCYEQLVYQGDIPTFGKDLPDGVMLALPIDPQTGSEASDDALLRAMFTAFDIGRWSRLCSLVPRTAAIYGDCLVQLKDDPRRGVVVPELISPWKVPPDGLELDDSENIKAVAIEYVVTIAESKAFGRDIKAETYRYRKEMTSREFRYYKDDRPWTDPDGHGEAVQANPYGFVPAAWFRHETVSEQDRGMGAYERTLLQAMEANSLLSSAIDNQRKMLGAPVGVIGSPAVRPGRTLTVPGGLTITASTTADDIDASRRAAAETMNLLPLEVGGQFVTIATDIGKTVELFQLLDDNMTGENPEAKYAQLLAELRQATGPGVDMTLAPIKAKIRAAQRNHDPRMIALAQMNVSMMGFRLNNGDIPAELVRARSDRYDAFRPYDLTSYGKGLLDASMQPRDPFPESKMQKAQWVTLVDGMSAWGMRQMGVSDEEIAQLEKERQADREAFDINLTGVGADGGADQGETA